MPLPTPFALLLSEREYYLAAETAKDRVVWCRTLNNIIQQQSKRRKRTAIGGALAGAASAVISAAVSPTGTQPHRRFWRQTRVVKGDCVRLTPPLFLPSLTI